MAILIRRYTTGGKDSDPKYVFKSAEEAAADPRLSGIQTVTTSSTTGKPIGRCTGSAMDALTNIGCDYRAPLERQRLEHMPTWTNRNDGVIDAWDIEQVMEHTPEMEFQYRRSEANGPTEVDIHNIPVGSMIGTGNASGVYLDEGNDRTSRHIMAVIGHMEDGTPLIYDSGKIHEGLPEKYHNEINFIANKRNGPKLKMQTNDMEGTVEKSDYKLDPVLAGYKTGPGQFGSQSMANWVNAMLSMLDSKS